MRSRLSSSDKWRHGGLAIGSVALAVVLRWWLVALVGELPPFLTFYPVVALVAIFAGARAGILATITSALAADYLFIQPTLQLTVMRPGDAVSLGLFTIAGLLVSAMAGQMELARRREAEAAERERSREDLARTAVEAERQRELLAVTLANIGDAVIVADAESRITFLNPEAERLTGWDLTLGRGRSLNEVYRLVDEHTRRPAENAVDTVQRPGSVAGVANHAVLIARDGTERPVDDSTAPIRDGEGHLIGVVLVFRDVTEQRRPQETLRASEQRVRRKLDSILSPDGDLGDLDLVDILNIPALQSLMDDFYKVSRLPMAILDLEGRILVGVGWQRICMQFHRAHPETRRHCRESDLRLAATVPEGECRLYQCQNHMWDIGTPIRVGGHHVGNLFSGQFFFEGEPVAEDLFRSQACAHGFDEREYLAALAAVPRMSREIVDAGMAFLIKLASLVSQLSYSNIKLARSTEIVRLTVERLSRAQEMAHLGSWEQILDQNRLTWSDEVYRIFGLQPEEFAATPEAFLEVVHPDDRAMVEAAFSDSLRTDRGSYEIEHRVVRRATGEIRVVHEKCEHVRDAAGRVIRSVGTVHDITERKWMEEQLRAATLSAERAKLAAESATRAKDQFIAVLSHELRTPLAPVVSTLSSLRTDVRLPVDVREELDMIGRNIDLEVRLIADLLDVSRIVSGKLHLEKQWVDVAATICEAAAIVRPDLDAKRQRLTVEAPDAPYLAYADAARLQQVFWNLLRNAIKFSPERSRVVVRAGLVPVDHCPLAAQPCPIDLGDCPLPPTGPGVGQSGVGNLCVEVIDTGSGIAPEMLPRLFNAFEQDQQSRRFGGLGLGLSICKAVVAMHGGTIAARSDGPGCGATFTVRLPVAPCCLAGAAPNLPAPRDPAGSDSSARQDGRCWKILLVEDHADGARAMSRLLTRAGHDVTWVGGVAAGLEAAARLAPDVLVSDLGLPDGSGLDLMRQLQDRGQRIAAIALSGYGLPADIARSKAAGFAEHLTKPLERIDTLIDVIARLVGERTS